MQKMSSENQLKRLITSFNDIVSYLSKRDISKIVVSGPQRSGTLITTRALSQELNINWYDESDFGMNNFQRLIDFCISKQNFIIQAPGICHRLHDIPDDFFIIIIYRDIQDIIKSQKRINWQFEPIEKKKYFDQFNVPNPIKDRPISEIKYFYFEKHQSIKIKDRFLRLDYKSLNQSELWIPPRLRPALLYNND